MIEQNKYFYEGIPLKKYCIENNLKYDTILRRVNLLKSKEDYQNYTDDEIVKIAF